MTAMTFQPSIQHLPLLLYHLLIFYLLYLTFPLFRPTKLTRSNVIISSITVLSLFATWSQMYLYFIRSYHDSAIRAGYKLPSPNSYGWVGLVEGWTTAQWMEDVSLFKEAWEWVCDAGVTSSSTTSTWISAGVKSFFGLWAGKDAGLKRMASQPGWHRWWWSEQICLVTAGTWTIFIWAESRKRQDKKFLAWAFMLLGQIVAISFASGLFFLALLAADLSTQGGGRLARKAAPVRSIRADLFLVIGVLGALISVSLTPWTIQRSTFLPNLLLMHLALFLPFFSPSTPSSKTFSNPLLKIRDLYILTSFLAIAYQLFTTFNLFKSLPTRSPSGTLTTIRTTISLLHETLWHHPAQASISWDAVMTHVIWAAWILLAPTDSSVGGRLDLKEFGKRVGFLAVMPVLGVSGTVSAWLALREWEMEKEMDGYRVEGVGAGKGRTVGEGEKEKEKRKGIVGSEEWEKDKKK